MWWFVVVYCARRSTADARETANKIAGLAKNENYGRVVCLSVFVSVYYSIIQDHEQRPDHHPFTFSAFILSLAVHPVVSIPLTIFQFGNNKKAQNITNTKSANILLGGKGRVSCQ